MIKVLFVCHGNICRSPMAEFVLKDMVEKQEKVLNVMADYIEENGKESLNILADKDNYPLAFHCAVGRDRTGTFALTLLLLLGVDKDQIRQDYVVSFFSKACNQGIDFEAYVTQMEYLLKYYDRYKGGAQSPDIDIYQRTENYCLYIGLSKDEIASIRDILLEDA